MEESGDGYFGDFVFPYSSDGHQRCSSENSLVYEQPSWFEDLLKDPETCSTSTTPFRGLHRRSASDSSFAYLEQAAAAAAAETLQPSLESEEMLSSFGVELTRDEQHQSAAAAAQPKPTAGSKECKRKQHNAHRSRVRKLQYIAHLEKTVKMLEVEGSGFSSELEFLEQQNMILTMENKALRQRLETISQEQLIKQWEQGMLEREIARLQSLYHLQQQQQVHLQMQHHQHKQQQQKQRRNKTRDLEHQPNTSSMKNKDSISPTTRLSINGCAQA